MAFLFGMSLCALKGYSCGSRGFLEDQMMDLITGRAPPPARVESQRSNLTTGRSLIIFESFLSRTPGLSRGLSGEVRAWQCWVWARPVRVGGGLGSTRAWDAKSLWIAAAIVRADNVVFTVCFVLFCVCWPFSCVCVCDVRGDKGVCGV